MNKLFTYTLLFLALALQNTQAQTTCRDCPCFERLGDSLAVAGDYAGAIRQYNAAKACDSEKTHKMNRRIEELFLSIDRLRVEAEEADKQIREEEKQAARNLARAVEAEKEASKQAARAEANAGKALMEKALSDSLARVSDAERLRAEEETRRLEAERLRTEETLEKLSQAFGELTDIYCKQAGEQILALRYDLVLARAAAASELRQRSRADKLKKLYLELAYYYNEAGVADTAAMMVDSLRAWAGKTSSPEMNRDGVRTWLSGIDAAGLVELERRYYPYMLSVEGGTFMMGSNKRGRDYRDERPIHEVTVSGFKMAQTETTWWQYMLYCRASGAAVPETPSWGAQGNHPVVNVSWEDVQGYIQWLNTRSEGKYRLPTEAEWEYAARGGKVERDRNFIYAGSNEINEVAWYYENAGSRPRAVAGKKSHSLGLYDMSGNVWEWCNDWDGDYSKESQVNPTGSAKGVYRVIRGGGWGNNAVYCRVVRSRHHWAKNALLCRVARRGYARTTDRYYDVGFRLVFQL